MSLGQRVALAARMKNGLDSNMWKSAQDKYGLGDDQLNVVKALFVVMTTFRQQNNGMQFTKISDVELPEEAFEEVSTDDLSAFTRHVSVLLSLGKGFAKAAKNNSVLANNLFDGDNYNKSKAESILYKIQKPFDELNRMGML